MKPGTPPAAGTLSHEIMLLWRGGIRNARSIHEALTTATTLGNVRSTITSLRRRGLISGGATFGPPLRLSPDLKKQLAKEARRYGYKTGQELARDIITRTVHSKIISAVLDIKS